MKKIIITGATGMVGSLILQQCLQSTEVSEVISLVRKPNEQKHAKLQQVVIADFSDYTAHADLFEKVDTAFFCIGVYTGQVPDDQFKVITVDYAVEFGKALHARSPQVTYCLLSGAGADRKEKSRTSFARYKGMAENQLSAMGFKAFHAFRPGYIYPVTPRKEPNLMYRVSRSLYPVLKYMGKNASIKSTDLAQAMFQVGMQGAKQEVLENRDMLAFLEQS